MSGGQTFVEKSLTAFIGLSHLGLVTSFVWTSINPKVLGIDKDKKLINVLTHGQLLVKEGKQTLYEKGLEELFKKIKKDYLPTTDFSNLKDANLIFFTLDTPKNSGSQDKLNDLIKTALPYFRKNVSIVIMSQVPVGYCREVYRMIKRGRPDLDFDLYHWVDILIMTNAIEIFSHPERIIIGSKDNTKTFSPTLSKALKQFSCPVFHLSYESAELTKAAINLYLSNSVTFANTVADYAEAAGANYNEIIPALRSDKRIGAFSYIKPGLRIAGGHLERDLLMLKRLAKRKKISSGSVGFILKQNKNRFKWALDKINSLKMNGHKICIWGLAYKKDSISTKNAASVEIIRSLSKKYQITAYDPMAIVPNNINGYIRLSDKYEALKGTDCLLILTAWDEFQKIDIKKLKILMRSKLIIDGVGALEKEKNQLKELNYISMGVGNSINYL